MQWDASSVTLIERLTGVAHRGRCRPSARGGCAASLLADCCHAGIGWLCSHSFMPSRLAMHRRDFLTTVATIGLAARGVSRAMRAWRPGVATIDITPDRSLWMAGFAARTQPSQGVALPLKAKALAVTCGDQPPAVL